VEGFKYCLMAVNKHRFKNVWALLSQHVKVPGLFGVKKWERGHCFLGPKNWGNNELTRPTTLAFLFHCNNATVTTIKRQFNYIWVMSPLQLWKIMIRINKKKKKKKKKQLTRNFTHKSPNNRPCSLECRIHRPIPRRLPSLCSSPTCFQGGCGTETMRTNSCWAVDSNGSSL